MDSEYEDNDDLQSVPISELGETPPTKKYAEFNENLKMLGDVALDKGLILFTTKVL